MSSAGSDEHFLRCKKQTINNLNLYIVYESYARSPRNELNMTPKEPGDFRERVERETIKG